MTQIRKDEKKLLNNRPRVAWQNALEWLKRSMGKSSDHQIRRRTLVLRRRIWLELVPLWCNSTWFIFFRDDTHILVALVTLFASAILVRKEGHQAEGLLPLRTNQAEQSEYCTNQINLTFLALLENQKKIWKIWKKLNPKNGHDAWLLN